MNPDCDFSGFHISNRNGNILVSPLSQIPREGLEIIMREHVYG